MAEKTKKKASKEKEADKPQEIIVAPEYLLEVTQQKLAESDHQNTLLRGLAMQLNAQIKQQQEVIDSFAKSNANREQRRAADKKKVAKKHGK